MADAIRNSTITDSIQALDLDLPEHAHCGIATDQQASRSTAASSASPTTSTPSASG